MSTPPEQLPPARRKTSVGEVLLAVKLKDDAAVKPVPTPDAAVLAKPAAKDTPPLAPVLLDAVLTWPKPAPITVGTPLGKAQLAAVEARGATLKFTPADGSVLKAGDAQPLRVDVDDPRFKPASLSTTIDVRKKTRTLVWEAAQPLDVVLKQPIRADQIAARLSAGDGELTFSMKPGDSFAKYRADATVTVTAEATDEYDAPPPLVIPVRITLPPQRLDWDQAGKEIKFSHGAKLSGNLFKASVPGTPDAVVTYQVGGAAATTATLLDAGTYELQAISPGSNQFAKTTLTAKLVVAQNQALIDWAVPKPIVFGTRLTRAEQLNATLRRPTGQVDRLVYEPPEGSEPKAGTVPLKVTYPGDKNHPTLSKTVNLVVSKAPQQIDWPQPADLRYPAWLSGAQQTAVIRKGNVGAALSYSVNPTSSKVGKVRMEAMAPGNDDYLETKKGVEINVLPPLPPAKATATQKTAAKISASMETKVTSAEPKPGEPGKIRGGHSAKILTDAANYNPVGAVTSNDDGTKQVRFRKKLPDGSWSDPKFSTLAPDGWDDDAIMGATVEVGRQPVKYTRAHDGATLHAKVVNGVQWEVIKDRTGSVTMSSPTGGSMTTQAAFG